MADPSKFYSALADLFFQGAVYQNGMGLCYTHFLTGNKIQSSTLKCFGILETHKINVLTIHCNSGNGRLEPTYILSLL